MITGDVITKEEEVELTIELAVRDIQNSIDFYTKILGFTLHRIATDGKFAIISFGHSILMLTEEVGLPEPRFKGLEEIRILVPDVDLVYEKVCERGGKVYKSLEDASYGLRTFYIKDPDGAIIKFASLII